MCERCEQIWREEFVDQPKLKLRVNVSIERTDNYNERLTINDEMEIPAQNFLEMCSILGQFQQLTDKVKGAK
jgi:hypothetical protein